MGDLRFIKFPLPSAIWSTNDDRKLNPYDRAERIRLWKTATRYHYQRIYGRSPQPPSVVQIRIPVKDRRRRDPHNYCGTILKAVVDGLVSAGAWPDDTPEFVGHRESILDLKGKYVWVVWTTRDEGEANERNQRAKGMDIGDPGPTVADQVVEGGVRGPA